MRHGNIFYRQHFVNANMFLTKMPDRMYNKADWRNNRTEKGFCMKEIRTEDAVGHILCHDITQIIKDEKKAFFSKRGMW